MINALMGSECHGLFKLGEEVEIAMGDSFEVDNFQGKLFSRID